MIKQKALLHYNIIFPLNRFWKNLVIVNNHLYEDEEDLKKSRSTSKRVIFEK